MAVEVDPARVRAYVGGIVEPVRRENVAAPVTPSTPTPTPTPTPAEEPITADAVPCVD